MKFILVESIDELTEKITKDTPQEDINKLKDTVETKIVENN